MKRVSTSALLAWLVVLAAPGVSAFDVHRQILEPARTFVGSAYCRGSAAPPCFDCSGFVTYLYRDYVPALPRVSRQMARAGQPVDRDALEPGDLVFFATGSDRTTISHVAVYAGQNSIIHAISDGPNRGVTITQLSARYWRTRYATARRVLPRSDAGPRVVTDIPYARGSYSGELRDGEPNGTGTLVLNNGDRYDGAFQDGLFHGQGRYTWATGATYVGAFADGAFHGAGVYTSTDGTQTRGTWIAGELQESPSTTTAETAEAETYMEVNDSPWETFDGVVTGDFEAWFEAEQDAFEAWKQNN